MSNSAENDLGHRDLQPGRPCLLKTMDRYFLVHILAVEDESIRTTCPGQDYPVEDMPVTLEFHDESGFNIYEAAVKEGPSPQRHELALTPPVSANRSHHRSSCRVETDLTVQVRDQVRVRRYDAALRNLSGGGALIETSAPFSLGTTIEMTLSLPNEPTLVLLGRTLHVNRPASARSTASHLFGIEFINPEPGARKAITRFIWARLKELYPAG
jgi:Tfp pilus assembly protein PilZ